jgi:hypothetical protein
MVGDPRTLFTFPFHHKGSHHEWQHHTSDSCTWRSTPRGTRSRRRGPLYYESLLSHSRVFCCISQRTPRTSCNLSSFLRTSHTATRRRFHFVTPAGIRIEFVAYRRRTARDMRGEPQTFCRMVRSHITSPERPSVGGNTVAKETLLSRYVATQRE